MMSPIDRSVYSFDEELEDVSESEAEMIPPWLLEFPDDMDVLIVQRNFEDAVSLVLTVPSATKGSSRRTCASESITRCRNSWIGSRMNCSQDQRVVHCNTDRGPRDERCTCC